MSGPKSSEFLINESSEGNHMTISDDKLLDLIRQRFMKGPIKKVVSNGTCCERLRGELKARCGAHGKNCPDIVLVKRKGGIGIPIRDGGDSYLAIKFCPFCGAQISSK